MPQAATVTAALPQRPPQPTKKVGYAANLNFDVFGDAVLTIELSLVTWPPDDEPELSLPDNQFGPITVFIERGRELSLPDNQFGPITVFIERGRDGCPIQIFFSAPLRLLLADAKCG